MNYKNFASPHVHIQSLDSASTPEAFAEREIQLGTGAITCTDHGTMQACREVYALAKGKGLTSILGLEGYVRDDNCPILLSSGIEKDKESGTLAHYNKYYHISMHALDQEGYEAMVKELSLADSRAEQHGKERKPLFTWEQLEKLGQYNITMTTGCLIGMVQRHLLNDRPDIAVKYFEKLATIPKPGNFYIELFPHRCTHKWVDGVFITLEGGEKLKFWREKKLKTTNYEDVTAEDLAKLYSRGKEVGQLLAVMTDRKMKDVEPKQILEVVLVEDFLQNECRPWCPDGDVQLGANKFMYHLAQTRKVPVLISDDAHFATEDEKLVQDSRLTDGKHSWKFHNSYHRQTSLEAYNYFSKYMGISDSEFEKMVEGNQEWASRFKDFTFKDRKELPTSFYPKDTLAHAKKLIDKHGRMDWNNPVQMARLKKEISLLHNNGTIDLLPYFFIAEEVIDQYRQAGELTGPGRGSAAGLWFSFLLGITHSNPLQYELSEDRFITIDRIQEGGLPDIDMDFPDRDLLTNPKTGWLYKRFGECVSAISTNTMLRLKSSIKDVHRAKYGYVDGEIESLTKKLPTPPQGIEDIDFIFGYVGDDGKEVKGLIEESAELQEYIRKFPEEWVIVRKMLGIARNKSQHACAYVICNEPVHNFIPTQTLSSGVKVTQYTAPWVEAAGGLKMDFLGLNSLKDLSACIKIVQERHGGKLNESKFIAGRGIVPWFQLVPHNGEYFDVWDLPSDVNVFNAISSADTETVFQLNTHAARQWLKQFNYEKSPGVKAIDSIEAISAFTALDRPGPLDARVKDERTGREHNMLVEFANRAKGLQAVGAINALNQLLPETYGVMVYQEQLEKVYRYVVDCDGIKSAKFRKAVAKKKMEAVLKAYPDFNEKGTRKLGQEDTQKIWDQTVTFGQYGFNKSIDQDTILPYEGGKKKIKDFKGGEIVKCVDECGNIQETQVIQLHDHGELEGFEIEFDDGYKVTTSINHKFLTPEGQKPLYEIIDRQLGIYSSSDIMDGAVRYYVSNQEVNEIPSSNMPEVYGYQKRKYTNSAIETQSKSRTKDGSFHCGKKDFGQKRYSTTTGTKNFELAKRTSRTDSRNLEESQIFTQELQSGKMVKNQYHSLASSTNSLWGRIKTSGFCKSRSQDLGRGGRDLPLFWNSQRKKRNHGRISPLRSTSRRHSQTRMLETPRRNSTKTFNGMFPVIRWGDKEWMAGASYSDAPLASTGNLVLRKIIRVSPVGTRKMYDIEVAHLKHNFLLENGVVTSNSHAICYSVIAYACAFMKYHYPIEWWTAVLSNADKNEITTKFWRHCKKWLDLPDVRYSVSAFSIQNDRIRAPLGFINGVGDGAHAELCAGRPYADIKDFCKKIIQKKIDGTKPVLDNQGIQQLDAKGKPKFRSGTSALNRGIVYKMIISGVMDSLFPQDATTIIDKINAYEQAMMDAAEELTGKRKRTLPKSVAEKRDAYINLSPMTRFQMQKKILPIYGESLVPIMHRNGVEGISKSKTGNYYYLPDTAQSIVNIKSQMGIESPLEELPVVDGTSLKFYNEDFEIYDNQRLAVACAAYVVSERRFTYKPKKKKDEAEGTTRTAVELVFDVDGEQFTFVKWPDRKTGKLKAPPEGLAGSLAIICLTRWRSDRPFAIDAISVIQEPIAEDEETEESSET